MTPDFLSTAAVTGLGGFDPAPMLIAAAALTGGVRRRHLYGFAALLLGGTALLGWILSRTFGHTLGHLDWYRLLLGHRTSAVIEVVAGLALVTYAVVRIRAAIMTPPSTTESPETEKPRGVAGLYAVAATFAVIVVGDPAYPLFVGLAGDRPGLAGLVGWLIWALVSQFPLVVLLIAATFGAADRVAAGGQRLRQRLAPTLRVLTTVLVMAGGIFALATGIATLIRLI